MEVPKRYIVCAGCMKRLIELPVEAVFKRLEDVYCADCMNKENIQVERSDNE